MLPSFFCFEIERIENRSLYSMYAVKRSAMAERKTNSQTVERVLWHGTTAETVRKIQVLGFNRSYCGKNGWFHCTVRK